MKIQCKSCKSVNSFSDDELKFDFDVVDVESNDKKMGDRKTYSSTVDLNCKKCKKAITLTADIVEYPVGKCEDKTFVVENGVIKEEPDLAKYIDKILNIKR